MTIASTSHAQAGLLSAIGKAAKIGKAGKAAGVIGGAAIIADTLTVLRRLTPDADVRRLALGFDEDGVARLADITGGEWSVRNFGDLDDLNWQSAVLQGTGKVPATHRRVELYVQDEQLFSHRVRLASLPDNLALRVVHRRKKIYPLHRTGGILQVEARPHVLIDTTTLRDLDEILFRMERVLNRASLRLLKVVPETTGTLPSLPGQVATRAPEPQAIDPGKFRESLRALRGQTAVLTGRIENGLLLTQSRRGGDMSRLPLAEIRRAAREADVNLIVLDANTPLQPGGGGWLGKRRSKTLDAAFQANTSGEFMAALARPHAPIKLRAESNGSRHIAISAVNRRPDVEINAGNTSDIELIAHGLHLLTRTREFEQEHDSRLVWWLPSYVPVAFALNAAAGVLAWSVAYREWWVKIWPPPVSRNWFRRNVLAGTRLIIFVVLFLPLLGGVALLWMVLRIVLVILMIPVRLTVWIRSRIAMRKLSKTARPKRLKTTSGQREIA
ncbi:MAG: hypothetical protein OET44_00150 [Gammaproteobacteria bacterium]|nr:hypothetical protein [Gammaproteobacteria bacterium]